MKSLFFKGIATSALVISAPAFAASDSFTGTTSNPLISAIDASAQGTKSSMRASGNRMRAGGMRHTGRMTGMRPHRGNVRINRGRSFGGTRGFVGFYKRPSYGFVLPSYWLAPSFGISNYQTFGLSAPNSGYAWSRYYDDAVLRNSAGTVYDYRQNVDWSRGGASYAPNGYYSQQQQPEFGPAIQADPGVYGVYNTEAPQGTSERGVYEGEWTGQYIDEEARTYRGEWNGQYTNADGQVYQGTYRGTSVGDPVFRAAGAPAPAPVQTHQRVVQAPVATPVSYSQPVAAPVQYHAPAPAPVAPAYQTPNGYGSYERCLKGRGVKGGLIGTVIGAVAGNRIAGRGNRLAGSLIGGGVGALAGLGIEKALDKCERFLPMPQQQPVAAQQYRPAAPAYHTQPNGYGWTQGYYYVPGGYYYPPAQTTVTVTPGTATTTTTVTEEYVDSYVSAPARKRLIKPAAKRLRKPSCNC